MFILRQWLEVHSKLVSMKMLLTSNLMMRTPIMMQTPKYMTAQLLSEVDVEECHAVLCNDWCIMTFPLLLLLFPLLRFCDGALTNSMVAGRWQNVAASLGCCHTSD